MRECSVANAETFSANQIILRQCMFTVVFIVDKAETCSCVMITRKAGPKGRVKGVGGGGGARFVSSPFSNGHLWQGRTILTLLSPYGLGSFIFIIFFCLYFNLHLHCHLHSLKLYRCQATWGPIIFKSLLPSRKTKITKKCSLTRPVKIQYFQMWQSGQMLSV